MYRGTGTCTGRATDRQRHTHTDREAHAETYGDMYRDAYRRKRQEGQDSRRRSERGEMLKTYKNQRKAIVFEGLGGSGEGQVEAKMVPRWALVGLRRPPEANVTSSSSILGRRWRPTSVLNRPEGVWKRPQREIDEMLTSVAFLCFKHVWAFGRR